jgi:ceramide glucosyltransferase
MIWYSIIRPLKEFDEFLEDTLASTFYIKDIEDCEVIFTADEECEAVEIARKVCARHPQILTKIIIDSKIYCTNPKLSNLIKGWDVASGQYVLMVDSNIWFPEDTLLRITSMWGYKSDVGIVCSPPIGTIPENYWAWVEIAWLNTFQAKWQVIVDFIGYGFVQGKVMAVNKKQFESFGGLAALASTPSEDASATKLIRKAGYKIRLASKLFTQPLGHRSFKAVWDRQVRWARLRRMTFPFWYSFEIFLSALPNLLLLLLFPHSYWLILIFWMLSYMGEMSLAYFSDWPRVLPLEMLIRDLMMIPIWTMGWFGNSLNWAGEKINLK